MSDSNWVHLDVDEVKKITAKAMLVEIDGDELWLPLSQISEPESFEEGDTEITVSVSEWIAAQKGLT